MAKKKSRSYVYVLWILDSFWECRIFEDRAIFPEIHNANLFQILLLNGIIELSAILFDKNYFTRDWVSSSIDAYWFWLIIIETSSTLAIFFRRHRSVVYLKNRKCDNFFWFFTLMHRRWYYFSRASLSRLQWKKFPFCLYHFQLRSKLSRSRHKST